MNNGLNPKQIWHAALGELEKKLPQRDYDTWLKLTVPLSYEENIFTIGVPNGFQRDYVENRFKTQMTKVLSEITGQNVEIRLVINQRLREAGSSRHDGSGSATTRRSARTRAARVREYIPNAPQLPPRDGTELEQTSSPAQDMLDNTLPVDIAEQDEMPRGSSTLNPRYTFTAFIVGSSNRLAHAAARQVAENPGRSYNPLFIYGGVGLGKTHLLHAIGHACEARDLKVLYVSSEKFTNDLINAIRSGQNEQFRMRYRSIDLLLIDDIQFIAGKESTQEEFFHTFNALYESSRQIVISSDRTPKAIMTEDRLRSRFEWGLIADIQPPDLETRIAILRAKMASQQVTVAPEVLDFIAQKVQSSIRELEGSLTRVIAYAQMMNKPVTVAVAQVALNELIQNPARRFMTPGHIVETVARFYRLQPEILRGKQRDRDVVVPRQIAMYLIREETDASFLEIGRELGNRDHTTILHGCEKINNEINVDSQMRRDILAIREILYSSSKI